MKCSKCKKKATIYLPYSDNNLCEMHFLQLFDKRIKKTNREFKFIKKGDKVAVALSGGKDSTVLLNVLSNFRKSLPFELIAITIDQGIICPYWKKTLEITKKETKKLNIPHYIYSYEKELGFTLDKFAKKTKVNNLCSYCGVFRRYILNKKARELKVDKLAIGHNLDDASQTIFLNLARNEPLRLMRFNEHLISSPGFVPRIKPLVRTPEEEVILYGKLKKLPIEAKRKCPYSKKAMRNIMRSSLDDIEKEYPGSKINVFNSFLVIQKLMKKSFDLKQFKLHSCKKCKEPSAEKTCMRCKMLMKFSKVLK